MASVVEMFSALGLENAVKVLDYETELRNMSKEPNADKKFSTGSSVYADQSIVNPNTQEYFYCIASILQSEIFEHLECGGIAGNLYVDLNILTDLPPHLGGPAESVDPQILRSETEGDPELLEQLLRGTVPTADTIYRYISWIYQSAKYSAQCNIIAFIYIKRIITSHRILCKRTWRGLWLGAIIIAQKFTDDKCLRTGSFASILPGITKKQLKATELSVYQLLDYTCHVKPSVYAKFYFELHSIFLAITHQPACSSKAKDGQIVRTLRRTEALRLYEASDETSGASPRSLKTPDGESAKLNISGEYRLRRRGTIFCATPALQLPFGVETYIQCEARYQCANAAADRERRPPNCWRCSRVHFGR